MFVRFLHDLPTARYSVWQANHGMPPFWELEALIADGHDLGAALILMGMRREASNDTLVRVPEPDFSQSSTRMSA